VWAAGLLVDRDALGKGASFGNMASIGVTEFMPASRPGYLPKLVPWFLRFIAACGCILMRQGSRRIANILGSWTGSASRKRRTRGRRSRLWSRKVGQDRDGDPLPAEPVDEGPLSVGAGLGRAARGSRGPDREWRGRGLQAALDYRRAKVALPNLRCEDFTEWMGHRPALPDTEPILSASVRTKGLFYATGHGHLGLTYVRRRPG
jgi:glycine/D-amino acid oxidase-like deaminating enzyme